jgi:hypothetical protein
MKNTFEDSLMPNQTRTIGSNASSGRTQQFDTLEHVLSPADAPDRHTKQDFGRRRGQGALQCDDVDIDPQNTALRAAEPMKSSGDVLRPDTNVGRLGT